MWPVMAIYKVVTSLIGSNTQYHWVAAVKMDKIVVVWEAVAGRLLVICL